MPFTENDAPRSDPALLDAYRKQLARMEPGLVYLAWQGQEGITPDDLLDEFKRADAARVTPPGGCPTPGCDGDVRYAAPGRRHIEGCTYPIPPGSVDMSTPNTVDHAPTRPIPGSN